MFQRLLQRVLFGFALVFFINTQSHATGIEPGSSVTKVIIKAAGETARRVGFIVKNPVVATKTALSNTATVVGGAVTAAAGAAEKVIKYYFVEETLPEGQGGGESTYTLTAITELDKDGVIGDDEDESFSLTLAESVEPIFYTLQEKFKYYAGETSWSEAIIGIYNAVTAVMAGAEAETAEAEAAVIAGAGIE